MNPVALVRRGFLPVPPRVLIPLLLCLLLPREGLRGEAPPGTPPAPGSSEERLSRIEQSMGGPATGETVSLLRQWAAADPVERVRERPVGPLPLAADRGPEPTLRSLLERDPAPRVRRAAAEAAGILGLSSLRGTLADRLAKDPDPIVRAECARALGLLGGRESANSLMLSLVKDPAPEVRALSAVALAGLKTPEGPELIRATARQDPSVLVRTYAVQELAESDPARSGELFREVFETTSDPELRVEAYRGLLLSGRGREWESAGLSDSDERIRFLAFRSWMARSYPDPRTRGSGGGGYSVNAGELEGYLSDPVRGIRELAKERLEAMGYTVVPSGFGFAIAP